MIVHTLLCRAVINICIEYHAVTRITIFLPLGTPGSFETNSQQRTPSKDPQHADNPHRVSSHTSNHWDTAADHGCHTTDSLFRSYEAHTRADSSPETYRGFSLLDSRKDVCWRRLASLRRIFDCRFPSSLLWLVVFEIEGEWCGASAIGTLTYRANCVCLYRLPVH
jgi:hypothetical protein